MSRPFSGLGDPLGHLHAELAEVIVGQPAVEDALRVVDLAVPEQVDGRRGLDVAASRGILRWSGVAAAAAAAAAGRAVAIRSIAWSSWAALTNHASNALGGR